GVEGYDHGKILFFFSSRRRHTRFSRDWSSDVCSSDLTKGNVQDRVMELKESILDVYPPFSEEYLKVDSITRSSFGSLNWQKGMRSEERRVGKGCRAGGATQQERKKTTDYVRSVLRV